MSTSVPKLKLVALVALVVGSMIGAGIFALPQNMAATSGAGSLIIAWVITFFGMLMLAFCFLNLASRKPDITGGVYGYARAGFGDYVGFNSAWGYWLSAWIGNISYIVAFFSALGMFEALGFFGNGTTLYAVVGASIMVWTFHFLILRGIQGATLINTITTVAKVIPILLFALIALVAFNLETFKLDFWGTPELGSISDQVKGCMLVTVWVFIGIEGASMFSSRAESMKTVGRATIIGFLLTIALLMAVSLLSFGILTQPELAKLQNPSMAGVLEHAVGAWGAALIKVGLLISVGGGLLAWTLLAAETPYLAAKDGVFPKIFSQLNKNGAPTAALWLTNGLVQLSLLWILKSKTGYFALILLATSMILVPYLLSGLFAFMVAVRGDGYKEGKAVKDIFIGLIASIYAVWLIYAAGLSYLLAAMLFYAPGLLFYWWAKREQNQQPFKAYEAILAGLIVILALYAAWLWITTGNIGNIVLAE
jgi:arginine:ornithine antiporter/lysine permease